MDHRKTESWEIDCFEPLCVTIHPRVTSVG